MVRVGCLHAKDGLHVACCRSAVGSCHHENARPWFHTHSRGESSAREGDGVGVVGVSANGFVDEF